MKREHENEKSNYSADFKIRAVNDMRMNHLSYVETTEKYWPNQNCFEKHNHIRNLQRWEKTYAEKGEDGLREENRGKTCGGKKGRPPKLKTFIQEDLIAENQRLRMEVEYLKKMSSIAENLREVAQLLGIGN